MVKLIEPVHPNILSLFRDLINLKARIRCTVSLSDPIVLLQSGKGLSDGRVHHRTPSMLKCLLNIVDPKRFTIFQDGKDYVFGV